MRFIACIEDPDVIEKILAYLNAKGAHPPYTRTPVKKTILGNP